MPDFQPAENAAGAPESDPNEPAKVDAVATAPLEANECATNSAKPPENQEQTRATGDQGPSRDLEELKGAGGSADLALAGASEEAPPANNAALKSQGPGEHDVPRGEAKLRDEKHNQLEHAEDEGDALEATTRPTLDTSLPALHSHRGSPSTSADISAVG